MFWIGRKGIKECVDFKIREGASRGVSGLLKLDVSLRCSITLYYKMSFKKTQEERYVRS